MKNYVFIIFPLSFGNYILLPWVGAPFELAKFPNLYESFSCGSLPLPPPPLCLSHLLIDLQFIRSVPCPFILSDRRPPPVCSAQNAALAEHLPVHPQGSSRAPRTFRADRGICSLVRGFSAFVRFAHLI
jgi:hypothetical protein